MSEAEAKPRRAGRTVTRQDELDAEFILESVLHRTRYPISTRSGLAAALAKVRADQPLKQGRGGARK